LRRQPPVNFATAQARVLVVNERGMKALGGEPLARIYHMCVVSHDPVIMLEAPPQASTAALRKTRMKIDDIDLFEGNVALSTKPSPAVPLLCMKATGADPAWLNVNGGAIASGHPLGASGTKTISTLIHAIRKANNRYGLHTMCQGGGLANVIYIKHG
jgi:acetyl-CoA C-acetyltransferase